MRDPTRKAFSDLALARAIESGEARADGRGQRPYGYSGGGVAALCGGGNPPFKPTDLASTIGWWKGDASVTDDGSGNASNWSSQDVAGGSSLGAMVGAPGTRPQINATGINSLPTVKTTGGSGCFMVTAGGMPASFTVVVCGRLNAVGATRGLLSVAASSVSGSPLLLIQSDNANGWRAYYSGTSYTNTYVDDLTGFIGIPFVVAATYTNGSQASYYNNVLGSTAALATGGTNTGLYLFSGYNGTIDADICEVVATNAVEGSSNLGKLVHYLQHRWSAPQFLFYSTVASRSDSANNGAFTFGTRFTAAVNGKVHGVRFYRPAGAGGGGASTVTCSLWDTGGNNLGTGQIVGTTTTGWVYVTFATPVSITAGTTYIASQYCVTGDTATIPHAALTSDNLTYVGRAFNSGVGEAYPATFDTTNAVLVDPLFVPVAP